MPSYLSLTQLETLLVYLLIASTRNPQNDPSVYVPAGIKQKQVAAELLLHTRTTFSRSVMVSVGVTKLGFTDLIFVDPGEIGRASCRERV